MSTTTHSDPARGTPRERLLDAAGELFYAEGVRSVGIDRVIERAGVAKASLYSTFGSKEGLVCAYLEARHERILGRLRAAVAEVEDPVEQMLAVFDAQAELFRAPGFRGCAFAAAAAEAPAEGQILAATESYRRDVRTLLAELAAAAGASDPLLLSRQLQLVYDGAGLGANLDGDPALAGPARAAAATLIASARRGESGVRRGMGAARPAPTPPIDQPAIPPGGGPPWPPLPGPPGPGND